MLKTRKRSLRFSLITLERSDHVKRMAKHWIVDPTGRRKPQGGNPVRGSRRMSALARASKAGNAKVGVGRRPQGFTPVWS